MSVSYFVINKCHKKIYLLVSDISNVPQQFTLENETEQFSLSDIMIEPARLDMIGYMMILGVLGMFVSDPYGGIIGALLGILIGIYIYKQTNKEIKIAKERLEERIKNG